MGPDAKVNYKKTEEFSIPEEFKDKLDKNGIEGCF
jgi:uncharacterized protein YdeI (YjbR/CyaY-like superfamily)